MGLLSSIREYFNKSTSQPENEVLEKATQVTLQPYSEGNIQPHLPGVSPSENSNIALHEDSHPFIEVEYPTETTDIHIGIDFGTSYTKACFYILDRDERTIVVWKPQWQSNGGSLLPSLLWLDNSDNISMNPPTTGMDREIRYFKMAVADQFIGNVVHPSQKTRVSPYRLYSAFFMARVLAGIEEYAKTKYAVFLRNKMVQLSGSMGIPISYFDSTLNEVYSELLSAARYMQELISDSEPIARIDELYTASLKSTRDKRFSTVPELYAEASGFFSDYHTPAGTYALFDIGGGTVDGASVVFSRMDGQAQVKFLTAEVDPLGVEIVASHLLKAGIESTPDAARSRLLKPHDQYYPVTAHLKKSMQNHTARVIVPVKKKIPGVWNKVKELPVVVCGGGQSSGWHRTGILSTYTDLQHERCNIPRYAFQEIQPYSGAFSDTPPEQLHRYLIAIGLSIPQGYGPEILGFPSKYPETVSTDRAERQDLDDRQRELYGD
jgi:hypothetical protein